MILCDSYQLKNSQGSKQIILIQTICLFREIFFFQKHEEAYIRIFIFCCTTLRDAVIERILYSGLFFEVYIAQIST